jgi:hypothetical protein
MLSMIIHSSLIPSQFASSSGGKESSSTSRFSTYYSIVRKIKKELGDRSIPSELNCLAQLLPIPKSKAEMSAWESFTAQSPQKSKSGQSSSSALTTLRQNQPPLTAIRLDKFPTLAQKNIIRLLQHTHFIDFPSPGIWGVPHPKDIFLKQPEVEADYHFHQQQYEMQRQQIMPPQQAQQQMFPSAMASNQQIPPTPATPSERPIIQPNSQTMMVQQNMMSNQMNMPQQIPNMGMSQPPNYMPLQPNANQMPKMHPIPMHHHNQVPNPIMQPQMSMNQALPAAAPANRGGRRRSTTGQAATTGPQKGQKRKKDSKANIFQAPDYNNPINTNPMQQHPSTAQFPHAPPSTHHQYQSMHHQNQQQMASHQQSQMWNMQSMTGNQPIVQNDMKGHEGKAKLHARLMERLPVSIYLL